MPKLIDCLIVGLIVLAPALKGSTTLFLQTSLALTGAILILVAPPKARLPFPIISLIGLVLAFASLSFLPATWFPPVPWRRDLIEKYGIDLPGTLSPQPWLSLETTFVLAGGLLWCSYLLS